MDEGKGENSRGFQSPTEAQEGDLDVREHPGARKIKDTPRSKNAASPTRAQGFRAERGEFVRRTRPGPVKRRRIYPVTELEERRRAALVSIASLARELGWSSARVWRLEAGVAPREGFEAREREYLAALDRIIAVGPGV